MVLLVVIARAWVCDDALITVRSLDNLLHGYGWRWNVDERVQVFTHPLWALLLTVPLGLGLRWYEALIGLSVVTTLAAVVVLLRGARSLPAAMTGLAVLGCSRAFLDHSTSGLETPLTALLAIGLVVTTPHSAATTKDVMRVALLTALMSTNRLDTGVLAAPALLWTGVLALRSQPAWPILRALMLGFTPLLAWMAFSIVYFGFPFPNTAYAKLGAALDRSTYLRLGLEYYRFSFVRDRFTLIALGVATALALRYRVSGAAIALSAGAVLYAAYVFWIGGDFMAGRFFVAPLALSAALIASVHIRLPGWADQWRVIGVALVIANAAAHVPIGIDVAEQEGVLDERAYYADDLSLAAVLRKGRINHRWLRRGRDFRRAAKASKTRAPRTLRHSRTVGMIGFAAGPRVHVIDHLGLTDPLVARMPAAFVDYPRIGHLERMGQWCARLPDFTKCDARGEPCQFWRAYEQTLRTGTCGFDDPKLCTYWDAVREVTRGDLFSAARWRAIAALNLGRLDGLIDKERYRNAIRPGVSCKKRSRELPAQAE